MSGRLMTGDYQRIGAIALLVLLVVPGLAGAYSAWAGSGVGGLILRGLAAAVCLLPPTLLMGATLPILVRGLTRHSAELGARISRLYWVNTLGAVCEMSAPARFVAWTSWRSL